MTQGERFLVVKAKGGFGNRILSAATGIILGALTERTTLIDWRDGEYLPEGDDAYPLLFASPSTTRPADLDARTDVVPVIWSGRLNQHPTHVISEFFPRDHSNPFIYRKLSISLRNPHVEAPIAVFWSYLPKMARVLRLSKRSDRFRAMSRDELTRWAIDRFFRPNERVLAAVADLFADRSRPVIGVHVRYTDRKVSLDRIFHETSKLRARVPDAPIFLATDNKGVQERFRERFDDVFVIEKELGDDENSLHEHVVHADPIREAENALIDMWALSSCDWLVHSRHSTFSVAAALIGSIPRSRQRDIDRWNARVVVKRWIQTWA